MANKVETTSFFEKKFKRYKKKFKNLESDLDLLISQLENDPQMGESLGKGIYKIRLASSDKVGGKSGGFRIITYSLAEEGENFRVLLITIYDKSEQQNILKDLLIKLIDKILNS